jgi:hypothetical protein
MTLIEHLASLGIDQNKFLNDIRGSYQPGFMQIRLKESYNGNLEELSTSDLGTFLHEYIHYLQNVSTPWGLFSSMVMYNKMVDTYSYIQSTTGPIHLPVNIPNSKTLEIKIKILSLGNGDNPLLNSFCNKVDRSKPIIWKRNCETVCTNNIETILLTVPIIDGTSRLIRLGAYIIKESMAALYQMQIDSSASHAENDLPYNLIKIMAEQKFPKIAGDDVKLITICYISLFSLSPAVTLIEQLDFANQHPFYSAKKLFDHFMNESTINTNQEQSIPVTVFFDDLIEKFKLILSKAIQVKLDYISEILNRIKPSKGFIPILSILYSGTLTVDKIRTLVDFLGMPYIYTDMGESHYPKSVKNENEESSDMIALIGHSSLFNFLVYPNAYKCCPLKLICMKGNIEKDECFEKPWAGNRCPMTIMGDLLGLVKKDFKW